MHPGVILLSRRRRKAILAAARGSRLLTGLELPAPITDLYSPPRFGPDPAGPGMHPVKGVNGVAGG